MTSRKQARRKRGSYRQTKRTRPTDRYGQPVQSIAAETKELRHELPGWGASEQAHAVMKFWREHDEGEFVYFIRPCAEEAQHRPVKIGLAKDPLARLDALQTGNPYLLTVEAVVLGGRDMERAWHKQFASRKLRGEWFDRGYAEAILALAQHVAEDQQTRFKAGTPVDLLTEYGLVHYVNSDGFSSEAA